MTRSIPTGTIRWATSWLRTKYSPCFLAIRGHVRLYPTGLQSTLSWVESTYETVARMAGARVIVDSSKHPTYGLMLACSDKFDVYVLHVVRDARAVAASWKRRKSYLKARPLLQTTAQWILYNLLAEHILDSKEWYWRLRWEDVIYEPADSIARIAEFVEEESRVMQSLKHQDGVFYIDRQHALAGNPSKLQAGGSISLRPQSWQLTPKDYAIVTALSCFLLKRYGYIK